MTDGVMAMARYLVNAGFQVPGVPVSGGVPYPVPGGAPVQMPYPPYPAQPPSKGPIYPYGYPPQPQQPGPSSSSSSSSSRHYYK